MVLYYPLKEVAEMLKIRTATLKSYLKKGFPLEYADKLELRKPLVESGKRVVVQNLESYIKEGELEAGLVGALLLISKIQNNIISCEDFCKMYGGTAGDVKEAVEKRIIHGQHNLEGGLYINLSPFGHISYERWLKKKAKNAKKPENAQPLDA